MEVSLSPLMIYSLVSLSGIIICGGVTGLCVYMAEKRAVKKEWPTGFAVVGGISSILAIISIFSFIATVVEWHMRL